MEDLRARFSDCPFQSESTFLSERPALPGALGHVQVHIVWKRGKSNFEPRLCRACARNLSMVRAPTGYANAWAGAAMK